MTKTINPADPAERWIPHDPRGGYQPDEATGIVEVAGVDLIPSGPQLAKHIYWAAGADCDNPVEWWRPWEPEVTGRRKHYLDGSVDLFNYASNTQAGLRVISGVLAGQYKAVDLRLADSTVWRVTVDSVGPKPDDVEKRDREYAAGRAEELIGPGAGAFMSGSRTVSVGAVVEHIVAEAKTRVIAGVSDAAQLELDLAQARARVNELLRENTRFEQAARDARAEVAALRQGIANLIL